MATEMSDELALYTLMRGGQLLMSPGKLAELEALLPDGAALGVAEQILDDWVRVEATAAVDIPAPPIDPDRTIDYGRYRLRHPWPVDCMVQGSSSGVVFRRRGGGSYGTAFVEASPTEPSTFIRGEGATMEEAEDAAWAKFQRVSNPDHEHEYETRGYRNGAGFCKHCGMFKSYAFDLAEIGSLCKVCGVGTYWVQLGDDLYCEEHAPDRRERVRMRAEAAARGEDVSVLDSLFDSFDDDDD